jgi:hypothetical protein
MNGSFELNHVGEEPGAWPSSEFSVRAALLLLAAGLVVCRLPIALILLRLTGLWSIRCRRLLGFIAHYIIPFWKRPKTISRYLFEVELCFYKFKIKQNK